MNKKSIAYILLALSLVTTTSCESMVDGLNKNPNQVGIDDIDAGLYVNTPELALVSINRGLYSRLSALWTGQLYGVNQLPLQYYNYQVTENTFNFDGFQSVITQAETIQQLAPNNSFYQGITRVMEAMLFGTYASLYGDIPCSEVGTDVESPKFDGQLEVFATVQQLLDKSIEYLSATSHPVFKQDYLYNGSVQKWLECAYTLKARYYMITREYDKAYQAAQHGISSDENSMYFRPVNDGLTANKNNYYTANSIYQGLGTVNLEGKQVFMFDLMDERNNAKTDETARKAYYNIVPSDPLNAQGISGKLEKEPIVTYSENLLILAEAGARTVGLAEGLKYLNKQRAFLEGGGCANATFISQPHRYQAYDAADFAKGGLMNTTELEPIRALLKEIIIERYVSGFTTFIPFDDARRLRGSGESDIAIDIPLNTSSASQQPERFYYPEAEMMSNENAPKEPGLYEPTPVNRK